MAEIEQAPNPQLKEAIGADFKQFPFLKTEQAAKEKAVESKIKAESLQKSTEAGEKRKALEGISAEDKAKYEENKSLMKPAPEFKPTQDNAMDLGALFSVIATMGVALGGSGKLSSMNALNAMGGMLKGWQSGRKDLFAKEQTIFDKETARIKDINDKLIKDLDQYQKLRVTDKEAALLKGQEIASTNPGVIASLIQSGQDSVVAEMAKRNSDMIIKMRELAAKNAVSGKGGGSKSAINERFQNTVIRSANETLRSLELMENIGIDIGKGGLGGVVGKGTITSEAIANLTRTMTSQDQLRYNAAAGGMALELAYVMNGGYKPNETQITELKNLYLATPQDSYETAAFRFADVVAKLKAALEVAPGYTDEQKQNNKMLLDKVNRYATPEEILKKINGEEPKTDPYLRTPTEKPIPTQADRDRAKSNPESRQRFINHFGVEP
jgi:hypothetical protein